MRAERGQCADGAHGHCAGHPSQPPRRRLDDHLGRGRATRGEPWRLRGRSCVHVAARPVAMLTLPPPGVRCFVAQACVHRVAKDVRERVELDARRLGRLPGMATNPANNGGTGLADPSIAQSVRVVSAYCAYDDSLGYVQGAVANTGSSTAYLGQRIQSAQAAGGACDGGRRRHALHCPAAHHGAR